MTLTRGLDLSGFQTVTSWPQLAGWATFCIVKAGEGAHTTADSWPGFFRHSRQAGILTGSYHLAHPEQHGPHTEAEFYISLLRAAGWRSGFDLPPVLDIERGMSNAWALAFMDRVDAEFGLDQPWLRCGFYVGDAVRANYHIDVPTLNRGRWYWRGGYGNTWPLAVPDGCAVYQRVIPPRLAPGVAGRAVDADVAREADLRQMAPAYFGAVVEEGMALTDDDVKRVAKEFVDQLMAAQVDNLNPDPARVEANPTIAFRNAIEEARAVQYGVAALSTQLGALAAQVAQTTPTDPAAFAKDVLAEFVLLLQSATTERQA